MPPAPRLLLALLAAASLALPACEQETSGGCPGKALATLALHGVLDAAASGCAVPPTGGWNVPATLPDGTPDGTYQAVFSWDQGSQELAYCTGGPHSAVLRGTRDGDLVHASVTIPGAVLGQCSTACTPLMTVTVDGVLDTGAVPVTFTGTLTEAFDDSPGSCGTCQLPCTSVYDLTGTGQ